MKKKKWMDKRPKGQKVFNDDSRIEKKYRNKMRENHSERERES